MPLLINKLKPYTWPYYNTFGMENDAFCNSTTEPDISLIKHLHKNNTTMQTQLTILHNFNCCLYCTQIYLNFNILYLERKTCAGKNMLSILKVITVMCHRNSYILGMRVCGRREEGINTYTSK